MMYTVLLVDDERVERDGIAFLLEKRSKEPTFRILQANNGKKAWELMQQEPVDILLTDVKMPYMDGLELSKLVCTYYTDTIIVVLSAFSEFEFAKQAMEAKAIHYLLKPVDIGEFNGLVDELVALCDAKASEKASRTQSAADKRKLALMRLFSGSREDGEALNEVFKQNGLDLNGKYLRLMHIETQGDFFARQGERFSALLNSLCPCEHISVSLYPNAAFVLLYGDKIIKNEPVADAAQRLCRDMERLYHTTASVLCGACVQDVSVLPSESATLLKCRRRLYTSQGSVIFVQDAFSQDGMNTPEIDAARSALETAIEQRKAPEIDACLHALFAAFRENRALEHSFLHHVLYDVITRLYIRYDKYSSRALYEPINRLLDCATVDEMERYMTELSQNAVAELPDDGDAAPTAVGKVLRIIRREYANDLSLDLLAERTGLTPSYLSSLFKKETGDSLVKYLTDYRLRQAKRMLEDGSVKVNQVARACGYENASYFNRIFKQKYGMTPSALRGRED